MAKKIKKFKVFTPGHKAAVVAVELDKVRHFRFDNAAIFAIERDCNKPFVRVLSEAFFTEWYIMLWHGLAWEDSDLTLKDLTEMLPAGELEGVMEFATQAMEQALGLGKKRPKRAAQADEKNSQAETG